MRQIAKTLTIRLDEETHRKFKVYAAIKGKDMTQLLLDHINELLKVEKTQAEKK